MCSPVLHGMVPALHEDTWMDPAGQPVKVSEHWQRS